MVQVPRYVLILSLFPWIFLKMGCLGLHSRQVNPPGNIFGLFNKFFKEGEVFVAGSFKR